MKLKNLKVHLNKKTKQMSIVLPKKVIGFLPNSVDVSIKPKDNLFYKLKRGKK